MSKRLFIALALLLLSASPARADFAAGIKAYNMRDWRGAIVNLRPLANAGDARAMILLANMYHDGYGVLQNRTEAMKLYKRAALEANNTQAMNAVAAMYVSGEGTAPNLLAAAGWFRRSALLGDQTGALFYGIILFQGNNAPNNFFPPDFAKAYKWYKICAGEKQNPGYTKICAHVADALAHKYLKKKQIEEIDKAAAAWKPLQPKDLGPPPPDQPPEKAPPEKLMPPPPRITINPPVLPKPKSPKKNAPRPAELMP